MSNNAHELSNRLLNALDNNYNVVDMHTVNEIISILERFNITKELLETTRLGKHVNELRRKTSDPTLARRAKVLVKRWRDLVIPTLTSPALNLASSERTARRLGGTPLTSPALARQVVSPAVNSPRPPSRPAWGGYESDSQDVILVDDDPPPPTPAPPPLAALQIPDKYKNDINSSKRAPSPEPLQDEKKAKRDKKPKKRRGHSRAGSGSEAETGAGWAGRNGRNGTRTLQPYTNLVHRIPPQGKKVKTTAELLEQIQSRGSRSSAPPSPRSPRSPPSPAPHPLLTDACTIKVDSPVRNGACSPPAAPPSPPRSPLEVWAPPATCGCGSSPSPHCPAAPPSPPRPEHVFMLHACYVPGVNGTKAPPQPHRFGVRKAQHEQHDDLFASVVPLYKYTDYADDYCVKDISRVPLCPHLPADGFAPAPPSPPPAPPPPSPRPYPAPDPAPAEPAPDSPSILEHDAPPPESYADRYPPIQPEMVSLPVLVPSVRLKAPILPEEEEECKEPVAAEPAVKVEATEHVQAGEAAHRTVERRRASDGADGVDGEQLWHACREARRAARWSYALADSAGVQRSGLRGQAGAGREEGARDGLGRPARCTQFAEWHECAALPSLLALPYVVID